VSAESELKIHLTTLAIVKIQLVRHVGLLGQVIRSMDCFMVYLDILSAT